MNEAKIDLAELDSTDAVDGSNRAVVTPDDHLATTRLPPIAPPPRPGRGSQPPMAAPVAAPPQSRSAALGDTVPPTSRSPKGWWRSLVDVMFTAPPPSTQRRMDERALERGMGLTCAVLAFAILVIALALGLHAAPSQLVVPPVVIAATVLARALVAVGLMAFGVALLRVGAGLLAGRARRD